MVRVILKKPKVPKPEKQDVHSSDSDDVKVEDSYMLDSANRSDTISSNGDASTEILTPPGSDGMGTSDASGYVPLTDEEALVQFPGLPDIVRDRLLYDGIYFELYKKMTDEGANQSKMLATAKYKKDFFIAKPDDHNLMFTREDGALASFTLFGEVSTSMQGTIHSAKGNHFTGRGGDPFKFLADDSKCKNVFLLRRPTAAPDEIVQLFNAQTHLLEDVLYHIKLTEEGEWKSWPWLRSTDGPDGELNAIPLVTPPIYGRPSDVGRQATSGRRRNETTEKVVRPSNPAIHVGALYDPMLLPDYGGHYFQLKNNKLVQHNILDMDDNLIPPWEAYDKLRPGTLILANVTLHCYVSEADKRKYYQVKMIEMKVIAESGEDSEIKSRPEVPLTAKAQANIIEMNNDYSDFRPKKKRKISEN
ncbi:hypothetical protein ONZ45_g6855 [Pleurotus djamor]|nr:hypothetical protein ONZ45_g6855 [Pleurotus djamor]